MTQSAVLYGKHLKSGFFAADNFQKLCSLSRQQLLVALSFYVQAHYRLRIGYTHIKAPVVIGNAQSVQMVLLAVSIFFAQLSYDVGDKQGFLEATVEMALKRPELRDKFLTYLQGIVAKESK